MLKIYHSNSTNPWFNLATEDWLFHEKLDADHILFLWRNQETVVIGRSQNPWAECHLEKMQEDGVLLARRQSGGGAVFHDLGNTNFTFISRKTAYDKNQNMQIIINALKELGIHALASGRNDIVIEFEDAPRKISGSAFKEKMDRAFHHGTLLVNTNLDKLPNYLNPNKKKLAAKGVQSVRSRVINLVELVPNLTHELICSAIEAEFLKTHRSASLEKIELDVKNLEKIDSLVKYYDKLRHWDWLYGQTLEFTHRLEERFDWGSVDIQLVVKNGLIEDAEIYSDSLFPDLIEELGLQLRNQPYSTQALQQVIKKLMLWYPEQKKIWDDLQKLFLL